VRLRQVAARTIAAVAIGVVAPACGGASKGAPSTTTAVGPYTVILKNLLFVPDKLTVPVGTTVTWVWRDGSVQHNVAFADFKSKIITKGEYKHTFAAAGTFDYICDVHPTTMKGTITAA
jgi:plastocyanin